MGTIYLRDKLTCVKLYFNILFYKYSVLYFPNHRNINVVLIDVINNGEDEDQFENTQLNIYKCKITNNLYRRSNIGGFLKEEGQNAALPSEAKTMPMIILNPSVSKVFEDRALEEMNPSVKTNNPVNVVSQERNSISVSGAVPEEVNKQNKENFSLLTNAYIARVIPE